MEMERSLGGLQVRLEILLRENGRSGKLDVGRISWSIAILHNVLIRMVQLGN